MRWHPAVLVLLICALSKWLLATDIQIQDPSLAGMPLSDVEYDHFFKTLNSPHRVSAVCFLRSTYGCQNALVQTLDLYENHGIVPEGRVCSDLAEMPSFPDFCTLTLYRCTLKKYFVKRIQCPDEISETSSTTQNTDQELENTESSSTVQETPLTSTLPPTLHITMPSPPPLTSVSKAPTAPTETITKDITIETIPKHPSKISITSTKPLLDLPISSTPVTTDSESLLGLLTSLDAVIAEQSFPKLFTTTLNMEGAASQHLMLDVSSPAPVPTLPSTSNAVTATPVTSVSVVTKSSSEPTTPEAITPSLGSVPTNPATTVVISSGPTSASTSPVVIATTPTTPSLGSVPTNPATIVVTSSGPTSPSTSPVVTATAPTTPSLGSVPTNPATIVVTSSGPTSPSTSPVVTATAPTTPSLGSVPTNPATIVVTSSGPTSASTSPVVTATAPTTPSLGSVSTNPATTVVTSSGPTSASTSTVVTATAPTTPSLGSVSTNPATIVVTSSSPTSASPSPVVTVTAPSTISSSSSPSPSSSTASETSVLLTKPTIPKSPALVLPPARVAEWPIVPISAVLGQYPLQPTSVVQLLLLPPGFGPRRSKPQAIAISSLLPFGPGPANIWQKKIMAKPPMDLPTIAKWEKFLQTKLSTTERLESSLPTKSSTAARLESSLPTNPPTNAKLEKFLSRLRDDRVQQLMQKMRELMSKGKAVKKQLLQSTSLQLLSALKNAKQKSVASLAAKKQL